MKPAHVIIPAAGRSVRMGTSKLLLPWHGGTVIDAVLGAWTASLVQEVVIVIRRDDEALHRVCNKWPVHVIQPIEDPADMKASVRHAVFYLEDTFHPSPADGCFFAPADIPQITSDIIDRMLIESASVDEQTLVVPLFGDRQGHPILVPWSMTAQIFALGDDEGLNALVECSQKDYVRFSSSQYFSDLDTPEEYRAAGGPSGWNHESRT